MKVKITFDRLEWCSSFRSVDVIVTNICFVSWNLVLTQWEVTTNYHIYTIIRRHHCKHMIRQVPAIYGIRRLWLHQIFTIRRRMGESQLFLKNQQKKNKHTQTF